MRKIICNNRFLLYSWNRDIEKPKLRKLRNTIIEMGFQGSRIVVNRERGGYFRIIDGQHRFNVLKELKIPITSDMIEVLNISEEDAFRLFKSLNNVGSKVSANHMMITEIGRGTDNYDFIGEIIAKYPDLKASNTILYILMHGKEKGDKISAYHLANGTIEISNHDYIIDFAGVLNDIKPYVLEFKKFKFVHALSFVIKEGGYVHSHFISQLQKNKHKQGIYSIFEGVNNKDTYVNLIKQVYNLNIVAKSNIERI